MADKEQMILDAMKKAGDIAKVVGMSKDEVAKIIAALKKQGKVVSPKDCFTLRPNKTILPIIQRQNMRIFPHSRIFFDFALLIVFLTIIGSSAFSEPVYMPGFSASPFYSEQTKTYTFYPEIIITINAPAPMSFNSNLPVGLVLFALPNGNTTDQTIGKVLKTGDDWHYDIQHIGAQTRFLRNHITEYNVVTVYLETVQKSWPTWRGKYANNAAIIKSVVDSLKSMFKAYNPFVVLTGHSGGGSFTFGYMNAVTAIPDEIDRISFLDSDYNYTNDYGAKLLAWLNASPNHYLSVIAYNDSIALYNGAPIVSATGGTWYRSRLMQRYLANYFTFTRDSNDVFINYVALDGRIKILLKQNPERKILHTVQVELNGHIQGMVSGTVHEGVDYIYYGARAYTPLVQDAAKVLPVLNIPPRSTDALTGSAFMQKVLNMTFAEREVEIFNEISAGNIPEFLRYLVPITENFTDTQGNSHTVTYQTMPDYLAIGSNDDFCRIPMGPITAQRLAVIFGATMPTRKLVDNIYTHADVKLAPVTYTPVGNANELVPKFVAHNTAIESQFVVAGGQLGQIVGGTKKDVVISNKITDPTRPDHVVIYGWHQLNGSPIQPLYNGHINSYVDYSHGIRFLNANLYVDSVQNSAVDILMDINRYKILSGEEGVMTQPGYLKDTRIPATPKSWGVKTESETSLRIVTKPDSTAKEFVVFLSADGLNFSDSVVVPFDNPVVSGLQADSLYFIRMYARNVIGKSAVTEVLAGYPTAKNIPMLIVNGFDRASTGNTYNFIRQHAKSVRTAGFPIASATNEAITDRIFDLADFQVVDYILGDESTADETFSTSEQAFVKTFLQGGGRLLVSGAELAWDVDYKGSATDKDFCWNFLKMKYLSDAPGDSSGKYYRAETIPGSPLGDISTFYFDNGTRGTINVKWPDVLGHTNGSSGFLKYTGFDTTGGFAGTCFSGVFTGGTQEGKVVTLGFPFETIIAESVRNDFMEKILTYFEVAGEIRKTDDLAFPDEFRLYQNYPNPFNSQTTILFQIPKTEHITLKVLNLRGEEVATLTDRKEIAGSHHVNFDAGQLASGTYFYQLQSGNFRATKQLTLIK